MNVRRDHITVCVCTYLRPQMLTRLFEALMRQRTEGLFAFSVVVTDNDANRSSEDVVAKFSATAPFPVLYRVEARRNIALARNRALEGADGEYIAFIDDDEFPSANWLAELKVTCERYHAAGVLGPVKPHFDTDPPGWIVKGGFCDRPEYPTGTILHWSQSRTGNVLFRSEIVRDIPEPFRPEFGSGGEDQDFFRRAIERGGTFVWCNEAAVFETVPPARWKRSYMLKRALLRGRNSLKHPDGRWLRVGKSLLAVPVYLLSLPLIFVAGHHWFMRYLIKLCDHTGRILALCGMFPVQEREM